MLCKAYTVRRIECSTPNTTFSLYGVYRTRLYPTIKPKAKLVARDQPELKRTVYNACWGRRAHLAGRKPCLDGRTSHSPGACFSTSVAVQNIGADQLACSYSPRGPTSLSHRLNWSCISEWKPLRSAADERKRTTGESSST
eukprot:scaffold17418_cov66-Phaeocystis_antarctica.AAC.4